MIFNTKNESKLIDIPIKLIKPNKHQPRKIFNENELLSLTESIVNNGLLQPLSVKKISQNEYELIAGERRLRACALAGISKVPCIVMKCSDRQSAVFALIENLQRSNLNMFEEALAIRRLILECSLTQERVAKQLGKNQSTIANKLRLLRLDKSEQEIIIVSKLTERHARILLRYEPNIRKIILSKMINDNLNVKQSEKFAEMLIKNNEKVKSKKQNNTKIIVKDVRIFINTISKAIDTMKLSGIEAFTNTTESDDYIEYNVKIPKSRIYKEPTQIKSDKSA